MYDGDIQYDGDIHVEYYGEYDDEMYDDEMYDEYGDEWDQYDADGNDITGMTMHGAVAAGPSNQAPPSEEEVEVEW